RIAWVGDYDGRLATEPGVLEVCRSSFAAFEGLGCTVEEARPDMDMDEVWWAFLTHRHWDLVRGPRYELYADPETRRLLKPEVVWEIENGLGLSARDVGRALAIREAWFAKVTELFETYDFVLAPSAQVFPFDATLHWPAEIDGRPMDSYHRWMETVAPWTMTSLPAMGMPAGFGEAGLPMGIQLIGRNHADLAVLRLAAAYESATGWVAKNPPPMLAET
ncbi:MAG: amidase, partial [Streptosporangiales bacterium]|nr:amidase [Streptosporangiales bacterium]